MRVARAARAAAEVVFERGVAVRDPGERGHRRGGERRAAQVRVQHDAGRVDDGCERRLGEALHRGAHRRIPPLRRRRPAMVARRIHGGARRFDDERARMRRKQRRDARTGEEGIDRWQLAARISGHEGGLEVGGGCGGCRGVRRLVSATTGLGTLKPTSPSPFFPIRFVAPVIRTT